MNWRSSNTELWNSLSLDLISIQVDGKIVFINNAGANMLGAASPSQLIGRQILDFVHPDYRETAAERIRQVTKFSKAAGPAGEKWLRLDNTMIDVETVAMPVLHGDQAAVQLIARQLDTDNLRHWSHHRRPRSKSDPQHRG